MGVQIPVIVHLLSLWLGATWATWNLGHGKTDEFWDAKSVSQLRQEHPRASQPGTSLRYDLTSQHGKIVFFIRVDMVMERT